MENVYQLEFNNEEHPVGVQLGGSNIDDLVECSKSVNNMVMMKLT